MREPMAGADRAFHLAAWYRIGSGDPATAEAVNVDGTRNVLELVDELDLERAVYTSTLAVNSDTTGRLVDESYRFEGEHLSVYDRTKWEAHYEVAEPMVEAGLPLVTVMPGVIYGPGDTSDLGGTVRRYLRGNLPAIPTRTAYCWGHVDDVVDAHVRAMERGTVGESYVVAGGPHTLVEAFEVAERVTGIDAPRTVPPAVFAALSRVAGVVERVVQLPATYSSEGLRVLAGVTYLGDNAKATRELGIEHRPFEAGFAEPLEYELERLDGGAG
jgi:nucleoside-diphosphate-sugar epimerase